MKKNVIRVLTILVLLMLIFSNLCYADVIPIDPITGERVRNSGHSTYNEIHPVKNYTQMKIIITGIVVFGIVITAIVISIKNIKNDTEGINIEANNNEEIDEKKDIDEY